MSQLLTLFWLRYVIFKNSLTARGELGRRVLNVLVLLIPLLLSLFIGIALFFVVVVVPQFRAPVLNGGMTTVMATLLFLMLVSQSTGAAAHFDPRRFVLFPINLNKLYLLNLLSALGEFSVLMILPSMIGILLGLGVAFRHPLGGLLAVVLGIVWINGLFICVAMLFAWLLAGRKRSREILFALLIGCMTVVGQLLPRFLTTAQGQKLLVWVIPYRAAILTVIDWTPLGVWAAFFRALESGQVAAAYVHLLLVNGLWIGLTWIIGYASFIRLATSAKASSSSPDQTIADKNALKRNFLTLRIPFLPDQSAAVLAKELRYFGRNPATYLTILSALIFPLLMFRSSMSRLSTQNSSNDTSWWIGSWVIYVFMMNLQYFGGLFAYDAAGFRQYLLAPVRWSRLLLGKNIAIWSIVFLQISFVLLGVQILDHNLTGGKIFTALTSTLTALPLYSLVGNYLSIYFPYRANFGAAGRRRSDWSGINLLIQLGLIFGVGALLFLPLGVGWWFKSVVARYAVAIIEVLISWSLYIFLLAQQGRLLHTRRFLIAEKLTRATEKV